jgi:hypothetical protein
MIRRMRTLRDGASRLLRVRFRWSFKHNLTLRSDPQGRVSKGEPQGDCP